VYASWPPSPTDSRNTRYQAGAAPYLDRTSTGWNPSASWRTHPRLSLGRASQDVDGRPPAFAGACFADHDDGGKARVESPIALDNVAMVIDTVWTAMVSP
jgi:hypothetical protein